MATFEEIKAKLLAQKNRGNGEGQRSNNTGDTASYRFWDIPEGSQATVRFLPDGDPNNTFFWAERHVIRLPFNGVVGGDYPTDKPVTVTVPSVTMFNMTCPITAAIRPWWKDPAKEALARQYWKKKSYIFQGFVVSSPFEESNAPENPIRRFVINPSIFKIIQDSLIDPEMEELPTDYVGGTDFNIKKSKQGDYASYTTSNWARRSRSLNESELAAIQKYGLWNLSEFLGRVPDNDELDAIKALFELSVAGEPFDMEAFGKWYRPYGSRAEADAADNAPARVAAAPVAPSRVVEAAAPAAAADEPEEVAAPATGAKPNPQDILERIRARTQQK